MLTNRIEGVPPELRSRMDKVADWMKANGGDKGEGCELEHVFHAGCYVRTLRVPKGRWFVSECLRIPTVLIVSGDAAFTDTENTFRITGYKVLTGAPMRQSIVRTFADTVFTAIFATDAKTQEEAEAEAVFRPDRLLKLSESHDEFCSRRSCGDRSSGHGQQHVPG